MAFLLGRIERCKRSRGRAANRCIFWRAEMRRAALADHRCRSLIPLFIFAPSARQAGVDDARPMAPLAALRDAARNSKDGERSCVSYSAPSSRLRSLALAGAAYAADATGTIKSLDVAKNVVTLDNGATYDIVKGVSLSGFKVGEKVKLTYTQSGKMMDASAIAPAA